MKKFVLVILFFIVSICAFAQTPEWAINLPRSNNSTMDYLVGIGEGSTYKDAYNEAFCDALRKVIVRFGVLSLESEAIMRAASSGVPLATISRDYNLPPMREVCNSQVRQQGRERVYLLYQIAANKMIKNPVFEEFRCDKRSKLNWDRGKYVAWNVAGTGYPWNLTDGIEFRYGGIVGIGGYLDFGMDFTDLTYSNGEHEGTDVSFHYDGGLKFFLFRGISLDCGYGTIKEASAYYNDYETNSHGFLFHAGYNLVTEYDEMLNVGFFLGLSAGASYDMVNNVAAPSFLLKIGVAWGVK